MTESTVRTSSMKWMIASISCTVDPPHFAWRRFGRQRVEHRQHRGRSHSCTQKNNRTVIGPQSEASSWRAYFEYIALPNLGVQVRAGDSVHFMLHAYAVVVATRSVGQRVVAQYCGSIGSRSQSQDDKLAGQRRTEREIIGRLQHQRHHALALEHHSRDPQAAESGPRRRRFARRTQSGSPLLRFSLLAPPEALRETIPSNPH